MEFLYILFLFFYSVAQNGLKLSIFFLSPLPKCQNYKQVLPTPAFCAFLTNSAVCFVPYLLHFFFYFLFLRKRRIHCALLLLNISLFPKHQDIILYQHNTFTKSGNLALIHHCQMIPSLCFVSYPNYVLCLFFPILNQFKHVPRIQLSIL